MGQADTLYILARQHQDDLMKVAEEARFAAAALTQRIAVSPQPRRRVAIALKVVARALAALGTEASQGNPVHA